MRGLDVGLLRAACKRGASCRTLQGPKPEAASPRPGQHAAARASRGPGPRWLGPREERKVGGPHGVGSGPHGVRRVRANPGRPKTRSSPSTSKL